ncbi:MAG: PAAR domain-containing protein [Flavobacteriales bacterium]|nr:PAAR domain-containing protein [Flavobacteriales bacterium]
MPAAARVGDSSNHGGVISGPGEATVLIGGMPASVLGDTHTCTLFYPGPSPHGPTPIPAGSTTVLIGGKPAIRVGDTCACGASAAVGEPTVLIG